MKSIPKFENLNKGGVPLGTLSVFSSDTISSKPLSSKDLVWDRLQNGITPKPDWSAISMTQAMSRLNQAMRKAKPTVEFFVKKSRDYEQNGIADD